MYTKALCFSLRPRTHRCRRRKLSQLASANHPPSTESVWPLINPLCAGSARNAIADAMSSGVANRPIGTRPVISASLYNPAACGPTSIGVLTHPGHTALHRTPRPPHSAANGRVRPIKPCLLALYAARSATANNPAIDATLMMLPELARASSRQSRGIVEMAQVD
jgi:hypothetical protein